MAVTDNWSTGSDGAVQGAQDKKRISTILAHRREELKEEKRKPKEEQDEAKIKHLQVIINNLYQTVKKFKK